MYCNHCGKNNSDDSKFCEHCGIKFNVSVKGEVTTDNKINGEDAVSNRGETKKTSNVGKVVTALVILAFVGLGIYGSADQESIKTNNEALTSFNSGDSNRASEQFKEAASTATSDETKRATLMNLGYVYSTEGQNTLALNTFKEARAFTTSNTFDFYLVSGEIALLEGKINEALSNYNEAYKINPDNFQINNALALFHLDVEEVNPQYTDYKKALKYAQKAYSLNGLEIAKQNLAIAYYFNEDYGQTISLLSSSNLVQSPFLAYWVGLAYLSLEDHKNARIYFQKAIDGNVEMPQEIYDYLNSN